MSVEAILGRLNGARRSGSGRIARCPAHEDRNPSLSLREENGRVLLHCFAGCSVEAVCDALKIKVSDLFGEPHAARKPQPRIVREGRKQIVGLRSRLTPREREREVTVVLAARSDVDAAIARALALTVEGELVQVALKERGA
jgi:hypothetical protein